nr:unnamed protein product [Callosobruchus chinensis]
MPSRKRFRRFRRKKHRVSNNDVGQVQINQITTPTRENNSSLESDDSATERTIIELLKTPAHHVHTGEKQWNNEMTTPVNSNNHHASNRKVFNTVTTPMNSYYKETTPANRDCTPKRRHGSLNVTNLNVLFTSNVTYNDLDQLCETPTLTKDKCLNHEMHQNDISIRKDSSSSMQKVQCSDDHVDHSTQTSNEAESEQVGQLLEKRCNEVYDTPRNTKPPCFSRHYQSPSNVDKKPVIYGNEININPYLKSVEGYLGKNMDSSFPEIFFSPKLLENKLSSTPIEKLVQRKADPTAVDTDMNNGVFDFSGHILSPNLKMNSFVGDKVKHKEESIRDFRMNVSRRRSFTMSPKSLARVSKLNRTRRSIDLAIHMDRSISVIENQEKLFTRLRRYGRITRTWTSKIISLCHKIGLELKNSLQSLCSAYSPGNKSLDLSINNKTSNGAVQCNMCLEYKAELDKYVKEIESNRREIESSRREIQNNRDQIESEKKERERLYIRLEQQHDDLVKLKENLKEIQNQMRSRPAPTAGSFPPPPPPPPCLPPPPPPPLPPLSLGPLCSTSLKITKKERNAGATNAGQARPVISLEDILKVKLKKTSDRCSATPTGRFSGTRRSSAAVSAPLETLEQVRLRPTPRIGGTLSEGGPTTPGSGDHAPTSPMTAMCRMLKADTAAVHRLKRLRRVGGYSCDSVYRRSYSEWREREL